MTTSPTNTRLDAARLYELRELAGADTALLRELVQTFIDDAAARVSLLSEAAARGDVATVGRLAHTLGGSSLGIGAGRLAAMCRTIETQAGAGALTDAPELLAELAAELAAVTRALRGAMTP
jgi:HPt (histidine-containing phosphotransfer) domain-containing protein